VEHELLLEGVIAVFARLIARPAVLAHEQPAAPGGVGVVKVAALVKRPLLRRLGLRRPRRRQPVVIYRVGYGVKVGVKYGHAATASASAATGASVRTSMPNSASPSAPHLSASLA